MEKMNRFIFNGATHIISHNVHSGVFFTAIATYIITTGVHMYGLTTCLYMLRTVELKVNERSYFCGHFYIVLKTKDREISNERPVNCTGTNLRCRAVGHRMGVHSIIACDTKTVGKGRGRQLKSECSVNYSGRPCERTLQNNTGVV